MLRSTEPPSPAMTAPTPARSPDDVPSTSERAAVVTRIVMAVDDAVLEPELAGSLLSATFRAGRLGDLDRTVRRIDQAAAVASSATARRNQTCVLVLLAVCVLVSATLVVGIVTGLGPAVVR